MQGIVRLEALSAVESVDDRKIRGAYFTPPDLATFLAQWAISGNRAARILDPSCGEGVFLLSAARELRALGASTESLDQQVCGIDIYPDSLARTNTVLEAETLDAQLLPADFLAVPPPGELFSNLKPFDAVVGNPPYVRYQQLSGDARKFSAQVALRQGVRLSGLSSSWASILVHAGAFLAPEGRLAMVLPAELLTVGYAEPIRRWLRARFAAVRLVLFETLQFDGAQENVVLLLANGSGGCESFSLYHVHDARDLLKSPFNEFSYVPADEGKWTDLLLTNRQRRLFRRVAAEHFVPLSSYGSPELGTVTGANSFFALNDETRIKFELDDSQVRPICPPGTRHLRGLALTRADWRALRNAGEAVWILYPAADDDSPQLEKYLEVGKKLGVPDAFKCQIRTPWWRPPLVPAPDLFFTYMSHRYPRLIQNKAAVSFLNSMHGVRLRQSAPSGSRDALPLLGLNSATMLGAEVFGRSYGGGILKMEPREAATLPVPKPEALSKAWAILKADRDALDRKLRNGLWTCVAARIDEVLLRDVMKLSDAEAEELRIAASVLRARRLSRLPSTRV
jgi:adenine-specific DNA-methyltransferase